MALQSLGLRLAARAAPAFRQAPRRALNVHEYQVRPPPLRATPPPLPRVPAGRGLGGGGAAQPALQALQAGAGAGPTAAADGSTGRERRGRS